MVKKHSNRNQDNRFVRNYNWLGILIICLLSIPLHFLYEWLGENPVIGVFTPINESIWEHLKLVFWPLLVWWGVGYLIFKDKKNLSPTRWLTAGTASIFISMLFIVGWYYTWVYALETESSIIDIGSLFLAVPLSQLIAIHLYKVVKPRTVYLVLSSVIVVILAGLFVWFTFNTPDLPLFIPPSQQT